MPTFAAEHIFHHPRSTVFTVLADFSSHKDFMPKCDDSTIVSRRTGADGTDILDVDYTVSYPKFGFQKDVAMSVRLDRERLAIEATFAGAQDDRRLTVFKINLEDGEGGCTRLRFYADFQLKNIALRAVLRGARLEKSFAKVVRAVERRLQSGSAVGQNDKSADTFGHLNAREMVLRLLPPRSEGIELGVFLGAFSEQLLSVVQPSKLHLVDPWQVIASNDRQESWYDVSDQNYLDALHDSVTAKFSNEIGSGAVVIHRRPSWCALADFEDATLDWAYIDADHAYASVRKDLEACFAKVRAGGLIAGDDYRVAGWWGNDVVRAVNEFLAAHAARMVFTLDGQFVIEKLRA